LSIFSGKKHIKKNSGDFHKNPFLYFGSISMILLGMLFFGSGTLAQLDSNKLMVLADISPENTPDNGDLYFTQQGAVAMETPELKIADSFVYGVATPSIVSPQTLGAIMGGANQDQNRNEIIDYEVKPGDSSASIASDFNISLTTLLLANDITKNTVLKTGQSLAILPVDGALHVVKSGDTVESIAKTYKAKAEDIIEINGFSDGNIFVGDIAIVPGGTVAPKTSIAASIGIQNILPNTFFINPTNGEISQRAHGVGGRGVDIANKCGTPVYAAAAGVVKGAQFNRLYGNFVIIAHSSNVSTYSGHLQTLEVKSGDPVSVGQRIGLMGKTGTAATGCHLHFEVRGAKNFLTSLLLHTPVTFK